MEFEFRLNSILPNIITCFRSEDFHNTRRNPLTNSIAQILDKVGSASSNAQNLPTIITSYAKFCNGENQRIYILRDDIRIIGMLKIGQKKLFVYNKMHQYVECNPLCILDFFVFQRIQRMGYGKKLIDFMLKNENVKHISYLGIDRPSMQSIQFFAKHYSLVSSIPQTNHFMIYYGFFSQNFSQKYKPNEFTSLSQLASLGYNCKSSEDIKIPSISKLVNGGVPSYDSKYRHYKSEWRRTEEENGKNRIFSSKTENSQQTNYSASNDILSGKSLLSTTPQKLSPAHTIYGSNDKEKYNRINTRNTSSETVINQLPAIEKEKLIREQFALPQQKYNARSRYNTSYRIHGVWI
ncbi:hypothetical protein SNEBB_004360 [Seison nebaliae]|nr:hypothetical protein SNEBB_004360 [Seison nebaliae]